LIHSVFEIFVPTMRVRPILDSLDTASKAQLKKLLPKVPSMPTDETRPYPSMIVSKLPKPYQYSYLGLIAEELLRHNAIDISIDLLISTLKKVYPEISVAACTAIQSSTTTLPFIELLQRVRAKLEAKKKGELRYDADLVFEDVQGHPDAISPTQVFEVKLTGMLKKGWTYFLLQAFAYAALEPKVEEVHIVLPLQETIWSFPVKGWARRTDYRNFLNTAVKKKSISYTLGDILVGDLLREQYLIGCHMPKLKSLVDTVKSLPDAHKPYQIFLGSPTTTKLSISDDELVAAAGLITETNAKLFVHSPYIINLCAAGEDNWNVELLKKNLQYGAAIGCRGVVVHVGKSTKQPLAEAMLTMKSNILAAIEDATEDCPLLLETPAGQGTEVLTEEKAFVDFVRDIADPRLRICIDTCHVFACGHKPLDYIQHTCEHEDLVKLIHYNDSATPCGSCVDRHAFMGQGHIGIDGMKAIAEFCGEKGLPMVIE
jgi:deoxyribonuclease-4